MSVPVLTLTEPGTEIEYRTRPGKKRTIVVDRQWDVHLDGDLIGRIRYGLITRERGSSGPRRYVYRRWSSPGWQYQRARTPSWYEPFQRTKTACIEALLR